MQPTFSSSRILLPVRPWFIFMTLLAATLFNMLPTTSLPFMPDWVAFAICFWSVREPRRVAMGWGFVLGIVMDVADASLMGQHALAYVLASYASTAFSRRILWFPLGQQSLHILPILLAVQIVQFLVRFLPGVDSPGLSYFIGPFVGAVLWLPMTFVLLLPQYRPVDRDENRPI